MSSRLVAGSLEGYLRLMRPPFFAALAFLLILCAPAHGSEIVALGDSLTAGLGVDPKDAFPAKLEAALRAKGMDVRIVNAGVSGDTTGAALDRLDWAVPKSADAVIVALGANDALRGIDPDQTRASLEAILQVLNDRKLPILLAGMRAPRNLGDDYARRFDAIFAELAKTHDAILYPFLLEGVATVPALNQADGMHPNASGVDRIVEGILPTVERLIQRTQRK